MTQTARIDRIDVDRGLYDFVNREAIPGTGIEAEAFWHGFAALVARLASRNAALLERRDALQGQIDAWHRERPGAGFDPASYKTFLRKIGYLVPEGEPFRAVTENVDAEIAAIAGPQLVVPLTNARFALNAVNARWGSLYDALYGTDAISQDGELAPGKAYNEKRGAAVIAFARGVLDQAAPLASGSWTDAAGLKVESGKLSPALKDPGQFKGY